MSEPIITPPRRVRQVPRGAALLAEEPSKSHPSDSITPQLFALIAECHWRLADPDQALKVCREGLRATGTRSKAMFKNRTGVTCVFDVSFGRPVRKAKFEKGLWSGSRPDTMAEKTRAGRLTVVPRTVKR